MNSAAHCLCYLDCCKVLDCLSLPLRCCSDVSHCRNEVARSLGSAVHTANIMVYLTDCCATSDLSPGVVEGTIF